MYPRVLVVIYQDNWGHWNTPEQTDLLGSISWLSGIIEAAWLGGVNLESESLLVMGILFLGAAPGSR